MSGVMEKILAEGIDLGMAQGIEQGMAQGIEQGTAQGRVAALLDTARNMLTRGFSMEDAAEITGLPMEEIRALENEGKGLL